MSSIVDAPDVHESWGIMIGQTIQPDSINNGRYDCHDAFIHYRGSKRYIKRSYYRRITDTKYTWYDFYYGAEQIYVRSK